MKGKYFLRIFIFSFMGERSIPYALCLGIYMLGLMESMTSLLDLAGLLLVVKMAL